MNTAITSAAPAGLSGLAGIGTALKGFVLAHPVGLSLAGGALLGAGAYWGVRRLLKKDTTEQADEAAAPVAEENASERQDESAAPAAA